MNNPSKFIHNCEIRKYGSYVANLKYKISGQDNNGIMKQFYSRPSEECMAVCGLLFFKGMSSGEPFLNKEPPVWSDGMAVWFGETKVRLL